MLDATSVSSWAFPIWGRGLVLAAVLGPAIWQRSTLRLGGGTSQKF